MILRFDPGERQRAFTRTEFLAVLVVLAVMAGLLLAWTARVPQRSMRIQCVGMLKELGIGFRVNFDGLAKPPPWHERPGEAIPAGQFSFPVVREWPASGYYEWFLTLSNALGSPRLLVCPEDRKERRSVERIADLALPEVRNRGISWFLGVEADELHPNMVLFGDRMLEASSPLPSFSPRAPVAVRGDLGSNPEVLARSLRWHPTAGHRGAGNVAMADGSVQQLVNQRLVRVFAESGSPRNTVVQPGAGPE